jgi:hypothetical protein
LTLQSEVERIRTAPRQLLPIAIAIALAFAVGIAVKEIFDSRSAGALAWILVFGGFTVISLLTSLPKRPELITPLVVSVGAGWITSAIIVTVAGVPKLAPVFLLIGIVALLYARMRSRAQ